MKFFFGYIGVSGDNAWLPESGEREYRRKVLDMHPNRFTASLLWLQDMDALDAEQAARLDDIYDHRHDLTHELAKCLVDPNLEPDYDLFIEALKTLKALSRFWTEVEAGYGTFEDFPDLNLDEVSNGRVLHRSRHLRLRRWPHERGELTENLGPSAQRVEESTPT